MTERLTDHMVGELIFAGIFPAQPFRMPVRVGTFKVDAELPGFGTVTRQLDLLVGQTGVVTLQMAPSTVQESKSPTQCLSRSLVPTPFCAMMSAKSAFALSTSVPDPRK